MGIESSSGGFPFEFGRESASGPVAVGFGLPEADVEQGRGRIETFDAIESADGPFAIAFFPVSGMGAVLLAEPVLAAEAPVVFVFVAAVFDEGQEFAVGDEGGGNGKGVDVLSKSGALVVEGEVFGLFVRNRGGDSDEVGTAGNGDVSRNDGGVFGGGEQVRIGRRLVAEGLATPDE